MPTRTVEDLQDDVAGILTGIDLDDVDNLFGCFERAVSTLIQKADVPEASGRDAFFIYDGVTDYAPTGEMFGTAIIDLRPQGQARQPWDTTQKTYIERFDRVKCRVPFGYLITFEYRNGTPILRVAQGRALPRVSIDPMTATTGWVASGNASGLMLDTTVYYRQPGALRFNLAAAGSQGILQKTLPNALSLAAYQGVGVVFLELMEPTKDISSIVLRFGSDANNYYQVTATQGFTGPLLPNEYQAVAFDLALATQVGAPNIAAMAYVEMLFNYDGASMPNVRVGGLWISLPSAHELLYYSPAVFMPENTTAPLKTITNLSDTIILGDPAYNLYVREAARAVAQQQGGDIGSGLIEGLDLELEGNEAAGKIGLYQKFRGSNPSEEMRTIGNWYED